MRFSKLTLAVTAALGASLSSQAFAIDLYVDTKTKQIYAEPGPRRELMGSFERIEDTKNKAATADSPEIAAMQEDLDAKTNELKAIDEHIKSIEEVKVKLDKKGIQFESADKDFKFKLGGRIHADASYAGGDDFITKKPDTTTNLPAHVEANDGTEIRRARMRFEGVFFKDWLFRTEADFADDNVRVKDAFLQYLGSKLVTITAGQQKQNFSRELQESSNDMMFTERSLMNILAAPTVDRAIGLNFESVGSNWVGKLGVYGDSITPNANSDKADEGWGVSSRVTYAPIMEKTKLLHVGVAGNYRMPDDDNTVAKGKALRLDYETTNMSNLNIIDTTVKNVNNIKMLGAEVIGMYGPASIGGEYSRMWVDRNNGDQNLALDGWYAEAAWTLTGESRKYKEGNMRYLEPDKPFSLSKGGLGAWELAARYSSADLNDGDFKAGDITNLTLALNWYINSNFRLLANYTRILELHNSPLTTVAGAKDLEGLDTFMLRGQVAF